MSKKWYVVQAYSGFEKNVQKALKDRIEREGMGASFGKILVPTEEVVDIKNGRRTVSERKFFPGYVLVKMIVTEQTWYIVRNTTGVTGFVGAGTKPIPLTTEEINTSKENLRNSIGNLQNKIDTARKENSKEKAINICSKGQYFKTKKQIIHKGECYIGCKFDLL